MKPHLPLPPLILFSLSVFSLLGLSPVASALAVLPPTARYDQKHLQGPSHNVHYSHGVNTASGVKTFLDDLNTAPTVIKPGHMEIPVGVSPPSKSAPNTGCTKIKSTKSILKTFLVSTVKATKNFPSTLLNFITATHPERPPHLARRAGAKRDLNQEDPKLSEAVDNAGKILVNTGKTLKALLSFVEAWAESLKHVAEDGHVKRDLNEVNEVNEVNEMNEMNEVNEVNEVNEMNKGDSKEGFGKAAERTVEMIVLEVLNAFKLW